MSSTGKEDAFPKHRHEIGGPPPYSPTSPDPVPLHPVNMASSGQVTVIQAVPVPLGPVPANMNCPSCGARITTRVEPMTVTKTHLMCLIMCGFGLWPCCLIPYCMDSCKNVNHYCPSCDAYLGEYKK